MEQCVSSATPSPKGPIAPRPAPSESVSAAPRQSTLSGHGSSVRDASGQGPGVGGRDVAGTWLELEELARGDGGGRRRDAARRRARELVAGETARFMAKEEAAQARFEERLARREHMEAALSSSAFAHVRDAGAICAGLELEGGRGSGGAGEAGRVGRGGHRPSGLWAPPPGWVAPRVPTAAEQVSLGLRYGVRVKLHVSRRGGRVCVGQLVGLQLSPMAYGPFEVGEVWVGGAWGSAEWWDALPAEDFVSGVLAQEGVVGLRRYALVSKAGEGRRRRRSGRRGGQG